MLLLDKNSGAGGTGGFSGLTTLCGLYDEAGEFLNTGFPKEFAEAVSEGSPIKNGRLRVLPYRPEKFRAISEKFFADCQSLTTVWSSPLENIVMENGKIISLNGFDVSAVIDCSGTSDVAQKTGIVTLETDEATQASAVVFQLSNVKKEIRSTADAAQVLLPLARAGFPPLHFHINLEPDSITAKFSGPPETVPKLIEILRTKVRGFENCSAVQKEFSVSRRAGKMTVGEYVLTGPDVLGAKKFPDAVARCAWPMEQWSADGKTKVRFLPPGEFYEIPASSLRAAEIKNLFMAGKTISADADAIASARVMGCCLATGEATAKLAVQSLK